jgi:predicted ATPase/DNA-binding SARP family transcriptional activator
MDIPALHFRLFGIPDLCDENQEILNLKTAQGALALYLLVLHKEEITRDDMTLFLWGDNQHPSHFTNLRQQYQQLKKNLGIHKVRLIQRKVVPKRFLESFDLTGITVDVWQFEEYVAHAEAAKNLPSIEEAFTLYRGDLLKGYEQPYVHTLRTRYFRKMLTLSRMAHTLYDYDREGCEEGKLLECWVRDYPTDEIMARQWLEWLADHEEYDQLKEAYRKIEMARGRPLEQKTKALYNRLLQENRQVIVSPLPESKLPRLETLPVTPALVGREEDLRNVGRVLSLEPLVTIYGTGGVGKTHLAKKVAEQILPEKRDGVVFIDLTYLSVGASEDAIRSHIATKLGTSSTNIDIGLHNRIVLLILDNAEHVLGSLSLVVTHLLSQHRGLTILTTSREPLGLTQEHRYLLKPLELPPRPAQVTIRTAQESPALQLFLSRVASPQFRITSANVATLSQICWLLEGIPLAIELAAVAVEPYIPLENLVQYLKEHLTLVGHAPSELTDIQARHRTMERTLLWSYDTLSEREQEFLRQLSLLQSTASIPALSAVCHQDLQTTARLVQRLRNKSLLTISPLSSAGITRYYLLEPIRQFANHFLIQSEEYPFVQERHLQYFVKLAEKASTDISDLALERENFLLALRNAVRFSLPEETAILTVALSRIVLSKGGIPIVYADLLASEPLLYNASPTWNTLAIKQLGNVAFLAEDLVSAHRCGTWCAQDAQKREDLRSYASALGNLGNVTARQGEVEKARTLFHECIDAFQKISLELGEMMAWDNLANLEANTGNFITALEYQNKALAIMRRLAQTRQINHIQTLGLVLNNHIYTLLKTEEWETARKRLQEVIHLCLEWEIPTVLVHTMTLLVQWLVKQSQEEKATWVLGACETLREIYAISLPESGQQEMVEEIESLKTSLKEERFEELFQMGREQSEQEARLLREILEMLKG